MTVPFADRPPQRILIVKPSSLGDVVHALPLVPLLRRRWPAAGISWLVAPAFADLLRGVAGLDELIAFDRQRLGRAWRSFGAMADLFGLRAELRRREFDLVIDLQGLLRSGWMTWQTRAPVRVGFRNARELAWLFYTHRVPVPPGDMHAVDRYLAVAGALGCPTSPVDFGLAASPAEQQRVRLLLAAAGLGDGASPGAGPPPFAVLLPGATWESKRWPADRFAALADALRRESGLAVVVAGGPDASDAARRMSGATDLTCRTSLRELAALLRMASLVVANDSGPMHIAAAVGAPLVAIFGPTSPARTGPYRRPDCVVRADLPCAPCFRRRCRPLRCVEAVTVEMVLAAARRQLAGARTPRPPADDVGPRRALDTSAPATEH